jgi:PKD repeat protein
VPLRQLRRVGIAVLAAFALLAAVALATVKNQQGTTFDATAGQEFSGKVAQFEDDGKDVSADSFQGSTIYWGDGTATSPAEVVFTPPDDFVVNGKHTYANGGTCKLDVTIKKDGGQVVHVESTANVSGPPGGQCASSPKPPPDPPQTGIFVPDAVIREGSTAILLPENKAGSSNIVNAHWDFGDGKSTDVGQAPPGVNGAVNHIYDKAGAYTVTLTVTDENGLKATATKQIEVAPPPTAVIEMKPSQGKGDTKFTLDGSKSAVPGGKIVRYQWSCYGKKKTDYDSEEIGLEKARKVTCVFGEGSPAHAALIVTSDQGETALANRSVSIGKKRPPYAVLRFQPKQAEQDQTMYFDASLSGSHPKGLAADGDPEFPDGIQDYHWQWGDGTEDHTKEPFASHAFSGAGGTRKITLTVTDAEGKASASDELTLEEKCVNEVGIRGLTLRGDCLKKTTCDNGGSGCYRVPSASKLTLNGISLAPPPDTTLFVDTAKGVVAPALASAGNVRIVAGPFSLPSLPELKIPNGDAKVISDALRLNGVQIHGLKASSDPMVFRTNGTVGLPVNIQLPSPLSFVSGRAEIAGGPDGLSLNAIHVEANDIPLPPFHLNSAVFDYDGSANSWSGSLSLASPSGTFGGDIRFLNGALNHLGLFGENLNYPLGYGVFLQRIAGSYTVSPRQISAGVGFSIGPQLSIPGAGTGSLFGIDGDFTLSYPDAGGWIAAINGQGSVVGVPVGTFGSSLDSNGRFTANVHFNTTLYAVFDVNAFLDFVYYDPSLFQASAKIDICTKYIVHECAGGDIVLSSVGIAACIRLPWYLPDVGGYYRWGEGSASFYFSGCSVGPVQIQVARIRTAQERSFTVAKGTQSEVLAFEGQDGPPSVILEGPGGQRMQTPPDGYDMTEPFFVSQEPKDRKTYVMISRPNAGKWTVGVAEGSTPVVRMERAQGLPDPKVKARVTGSGTKRRLTWSATPIKGQRITFSEQGAIAGRPIGTTTRARGSMPFTPADGPKGKRTIVAEVIQSGNPRANLNVASYTAPRVGPARPRGLRLRRRGSSLVVSWSRVAGVAGYEVNATISDGRRIPLLTAGTSVTIPSFQRSETARVTVAGYRVAGVNGPAAKAGLKPPKAKKKKR